MSTSAFRIPVFHASATRVLQTSARDWGLSWPLPQRARHRAPVQAIVPRAGQGRARRALDFAFAI